MLDQISNNGRSIRIQSKTVMQFEHWYRFYIAKILLNMAKTELTHTHKMKKIHASSVWLKKNKGREREKKTRNNLMNSQKS